MRLFGRGDGGEPLAVWAGLPLADATVRVATDEGLPRATRERGRDRPFVRAFWPVECADDGITVMSVAELIARSPREADLAVGVGAAEVTLDRRDLASYRAVPAHGSVRDLGRDPVLRLVTPPEWALLGAVQAALGPVRGLRGYAREDRLLTLLICLRDERPDAAKTFERVCREAGCPQAVELWRWDDLPSTVRTVAEKALARASDGQRRAMETDDGW